MKHAVIIVAVVMFSSSVFADEFVSPDIKVEAVRLNESIIIDGLLTETVWKNGNAVDCFLQRDPNEGEQPTEQTEVRVIYDNDAIYVGAVMFDSSPDSIVARLGRRDARLSSDQFCLYIDPYYDKRSGFFFAINPAGTISDGVLLNDDWDDDSWDGIWEGKACITDRGWSAEMRIPYSQLRFHKKDKYTWGINFSRTIQRKNEEVFVTFTPKDGSGFVSRFVDLVGIEKISPSRQIEVLPYVRSKAEYTNPEAGDPFNDGSLYTPAMGADIKIGLSSNLTLDATVNPDFGQVEVDPAVVNLSDVETYFSEKRPFFIEGSSIFRFGRGGARSFYGLNWAGPSFFYSRRIGRAPQGSLPDDYDYSKTPEGTRILGAGKLSGKIGDMSVGMLHAVTAKEYGEIEYDGTRSKHEIEPLTYYGVYRGLKEFDESRHGLGFLSTVAARRFDDPSLQDEFNSGAYVFGIDGWTFLDSSKTWVVTGWAGMSHVRANANRMADLQQSSRHYFQRPDVDHVSLDTTATSMTGYAGRVWLNKQKGNVLFNAAFGFITPKFDVNDVGFMWRTDQINGHVIGGYKWVKPGLFTRHAELHFALFGSTDFGGNPIWSGFFHMGYLKLLNYYNIDWMYAYNPESYSNRLTRGGPLSKNPAGWEGGLNISSDNRKPWVMSIGGHGGDYGKTKYWNIYGSIEWKPVSNISFSISPRYSSDNDYAQYVDTWEDPLATETYGKRYVFASIKYRQLSAGIRLNWTFTPKLSLQLYAQPLISSGDYYDFKELARAGEYEFLTYGENGSTYSPDTFTADPDGSGEAEPMEIGNPDFNYKSLRGNVVLRWEYMPGSTLYLVWTQSRSHEEEIGNFQFSKSLDRLWNAEVDNIFMIKVAYWLNL